VSVGPGTDRPRWCGICKRYVTEEAWRMVHVPKHTEGLLRAAGIGR